MSNQCDNLTKNGRCRYKGNLVSQFVSQFNNFGPSVYRYYMCKMHINKDNRNMARYRRKTKVVNHIDDDDLLQT